MVGYIYLLTYCLLHIGRGFYDALMTNCGDQSSELELCDIYQGKVYQEFKQNQQQDTLNGYISISFTLNTDGALLFQSSSCSMWPVLLMINELPFNERFSNIVIIYILKVCYLY